MLRRWLAAQFARPSGWAGRLWMGPWLDRIGRPMNALALEQLEVGRQDSVLEVGFGGGDLLQSLLAATSGAVIGVDISEAMLNRAKRRFRREIADGRLRLLPGSADDTRLPDASVDKACSVNTLYFWRDPSAAMSEFARVIRPGGTFALCFQTPDAVRAWSGHHHGFSAFSEAEVNAWMKAAGFGMVRVAYGSDPKLGDFVCIKGLRGSA